MEFEYAVQWLKEGKKIRRKCWNPEVYIYLSNEAILWHNNNQVNFRIRQFVADDWEIYEEEKVELPKSELLNVLDILKDKDVKIEHLFIRVYDMESKKEGWISFEQVVNNIEKVLKELKVIK